MAQAYIVDFWFNICANVQLMQSWEDNNVEDV